MALKRGVWKAQSIWLDKKPYTVSSIDILNRNVNINGLKYTGNIESFTISADKLIECASERVIDKTRSYELARYVHREELRMANKSKKSISKSDALHFVICWVQDDFSYFNSMPIMIRERDTFERYNTILNTLNWKEYYKKIGKDTEVIV